MERNPGPGTSVKVGLVQMSMAADAEANLEKAARMVHSAAERGANIVCLPELFTTRYFPYNKRSPARPEPIPGPTTRFLSEVARKNSVVLVGGSLFERAGNRAYNSCPLFSEKGRLLSVYRKVHLPQDEHFYEQSYFSPGTKYAVCKTTFGNVGTLICFDQWYPEAARVNRLKGADFVFYPTAIGRVRGIEESEGDWQRAWEAVQVGHAIANGMVVCSANRVGVEGGTTFWGGSFVCDQFGKVVARAGVREEVVVAEVDLALGPEVEEGWGFLRGRRKSTYGELAR